MHRSRLIGIFRLAGVAIALISGLLFALGRGGDGSVRGAILPPDSTSSRLLQPLDFKVEIADSFGQQLPDPPKELEVFERVDVTVPHGAGDPTVNEIGLKALVTGPDSGGAKTFKWTIQDIDKADMTQKWECTQGSFGPVTKTGQPLDTPGDEQIQFKSWDGIGGGVGNVVNRTVTLDVTIGPTTVSKTIAFKVMANYVTPALLIKHSKWHGAATEADGGVENNIARLKYKIGYFFLQYHREFAVTDFPLLRDDVLLTTSSGGNIPLTIPYPFRAEPSAFGSFAGGEPTGLTNADLIASTYATTHDLGDFINGGAHANYHSYYCCNGDGDSFASPRDPYLYYFHKRVDEMWKTWQGNNQFAPNFLTLVDSITVDGTVIPINPDNGEATDGESVPGVTSVVVNFRDDVGATESDRVIASDLKVNGSDATLVTGAGTGPFTFTGFATPAPGVVTLALKGGTEATAGSPSGSGIRHIEAASDPDGRVNPFKEETWTVNLQPAPPVGGIAEVLVGKSDSPASPADGSSSDRDHTAPIAAAVAAGAVVALAGGAWYVRRRWLR